MADSFYKTRYGRSFQAGQGLPVISTDLDSHRVYQFEVQFHGLPSDLRLQQQDLTLAAKQVSPPGMSVEDIEVNRVNDKIFYPGKASPEEITITFDNLLLRNTAETLWNWFKSTYDPLTGELTKNSAPGGSSMSTFKANKMDIFQLDNTGAPHSTIQLYGVWPKSWKAAELNYSTNEFHTLEVTFRYDFMDQYNEENSIV